MDTCILVHVASGGRERLASYIEDSPITGRRHFIFDAKMDWERGQRGQTSLLQHFSGTDCQYVGLATRLTE